MASELDPNSIRRELDAIGQEAARRRRIVAEASASAKALQSQWQSRLPGRRAELAEQEEKRRTRTRKAVEANASEAIGNAREIIARSVRAESPGLLGAMPGDEQWRASPLPPPHLGSCLRIGELRQYPGVPVVAPLLNSSGWSVSGDQQSFAAFAQLASLRLFFALGPDNVSLSVYDPDFVMELGNLAEIKRASPSSVRPAVSTPENLEPLLEDLVGHVREVADDLTSEGYDNVLDGFAGTGRLPHPLQILIIAAGVDDLSDRAAKRLSQLLQVGRNRGLVVISYAAGRPLAMGRDSVQITLAGQRSTVSTLGGIEFQLDPLPDRAQALKLSAHLATAPKASTAPMVGFAEFNDDVMEEAWLDAGDEGLEVAIGKIGRHPLVIRLRSENPPMPNALIGGAVGQGKSNLLLVLIHALATKYAPSDLEFVLLDFKEGVEFGRLGPDENGRNGLPHIRAMGMEFDVDFGIAALEWVVQEMSDRADKFRDARAVSLSEYRAQGRSMSRVVVVIDEFQRLFEGDDDVVDLAASLLEKIARTGRSFGVHLVLSSQTITGIRGLAAKSDAIFAQFHNRISMKNTPSESAAILAPQNTAAAALRDRGEVIVNDSLGEPSANVRGMAAYADAGYLERLRAQLWTMGGSGREPRIFRASALASWPVGYQPVRGDVMVGSPISLDESFRVAQIRPSVQQSLALLGSNSNLSSLVIAGAVRSQLPWLGRVVVLDGVGIDAAHHPVLHALLAQLRRAGVGVEVVARLDVAKRVLELADAVEDESSELPDLVMLFGMDSITTLEDSDPLTFIAGTERLQRFLTLSGQRGVLCLGWWQTMSRLRKHAGFDYAGIRGFVLCDASKADVQDICGPLVRPPSAEHRVMWMDRAGGSRVEVLVPFAFDDSAGGGK